MRNQLSHEKQPRKSIAHPSCTMKKELWEVLAVIHDMTERRTACTHKNITAHFGVGISTARSRLEILMNEYLIDSDETLRPSGTGSVTVFGLTNEGYAELYAFSHNVTSDADAQRFYSGHFKRVAA